jgi:uncharacterized protein YjiS (DUF1127 family)
MTHLVQTLNNYSLRPISDFITETLSRIGNAWVSALEVEAFRRVHGELRKYRTYRKTYDELSVLTDKELNDIGINRSMIHSVALEAYLDNQAK